MLYGSQSIGSIQPFENTNPFIKVFAPASDFIEPYRFCHPAACEAFIVAADGFLDAF